MRERERERESYQHSLNIHPSDRQMCFRAVRPTHLWSDNAVPHTGPPQPRTTRRPLHLSTGPMPQSQDVLPASRIVCCLTSQQHACVSQGRVCSDNLTCCHTEIQVAYQTFYLTQSQYTDTGPTSPSGDPITPDTWQGNHWSAKFEVTDMTRPGKNPASSGIRTPDFPLPRRTH